ncbi:hypothetical protein NHL50_11370 [Acidimicrobiia bacterium EGI L10123]|uniref:hypothetical protein n=1 Tax=Salinilacustrithrix flava TaxID=2957203 RepID=UPI003D7C2183|nr:hypothetical protein [Acidimicrobiia bacterium EGI L10123]
MVVMVLALVAVAVVAGLSLLRGRHRSHTSALIHVDDLAVGAGPAVCAITGEPTDHWVRVSSSEGGFQGWWMILVLFGPVGWIALVVLAAMARRPNRVSGVLPISAEALDRYNAAVATSQRAIIAAGLAMVAWIGAVVWDGGGIGTPAIVAVSALVGVGVVVWLGASIAAPFRWIDLELDGSGRWVTVTRAHPEYAAALMRHNASVHVRRS